jgi:hypothetical protein
MALDSPTDHALALRGVDEVHVLVGVGAPVEHGKPVVGMKIDSDRNRSRKGVSLR